VLYPYKGFDTCVEAASEKSCGTAGEPCLFIDRAIWKGEVSSDLGPFTDSYGECGIVWKVS